MKDQFGKCVFAYRGWIISSFFFVLLCFSWMSHNVLSYYGLLPAVFGWGMRIITGMYIGKHTNGDKISGETLAVTGIYRVSRNPLYISNIFICEGLLLFSNNTAFWVHFSMIITIILFYHYVIILEEKYLINTWKETYRRYAQSVPRWVSLSSIRANYHWSPIVSIQTAVANQLPNTMKSMFAALLIYILS
jgi:protein-S-isoprenylcysteine O-methyltransferase Ste14